MFKFKADDKSWGDFYWVGDPECQHIGELESKIIENRYKLDVIGGVVDDTLSYEYDEFALILLDGDYYLLETSGCSCPSPSETWRVVHGPNTIHEILGKITSGDYQGYTLPATKMGEFIMLINEEILRVRESGTYCH